MKKHYGSRLRMLHCCTDQLMTAALAEMGLTAAQGHIVGFLSHCAEAPCPHDIEKAFRLSHPTVSGLLSRLEKKEFIGMHPDPEDKRCKRIYLLPRGEQCHQRIREVIGSIEKQLVRDFTPEEQELFSGFLDRAITNMGGHTPRLFHTGKEE